MTSKQKAFTLIEMVVAIAVFAVFAAMVSTAYVASVQNQERAKMQLSRLAEIQLAMSILGRNFEQITNRPIRDEYGEKKPAFISQAEPDKAVEFTHTGRLPTGFPGSALARVAFGVSEEKLWKYAWPVLDRAQDSQPFKSELLTQVEALELRYLDDKNEWQFQWPAVVPVEGQPDPIPRAVELSVNTKDWGKIKRIFVIPEVGSSAPAAAK